MRIVIARQELLAAALFASTDETRYVINGLALQRNRRGAKPVVVATDGRRLVVLETVADQPETEDEGLFSVVMAPVFCQIVCAISKTVGGKLQPWVEFDIKEHVVTATVVGAEAEFTVRRMTAVIDGEFPKWKDVLPPRDTARVAVTEIGFNAEYLGDFAKAATLLGASDKLVNMNLVGKDSAVEVKMPSVGTFYGLVMPCKLLSEGTEYQPEFVTIMDQVPAKHADEEQDAMTPPATEAAAETPPAAATEAKAPAENKAVKKRGKVTERTEAGTAAETIDKFRAYLRAGGIAGLKDAAKGCRVSVTIAGEVFDELEANGEVGPSQDGNPRQVLALKP